jgi:hypothetical protein
MKQVKIGLTEKLRQRLDEAAKVEGRTLSEEVRTRLEESIYDDSMPDFARVMGREVATIAQIVMLSALEKKPDGKPVTKDDIKKARGVIWRAMVVATNDYFAELKPKHFSSEPILPPPTEPDVRADAIGHAAAQALFLWASGEAKAASPEVDWMFKPRQKPQEETP